MSSNESAVRVRAYEIWEAEGRPHGKDAEHWLMALQEMAATMAAVAPKKKAAAKKAEMPSNAVVDLKDAAPKKKAAKKT